MFVLYLTIRWILYAFLTAAVTYRTIAEMRGTRSEFSYVLGEARSLVLPVMGVAFVTILILVGVMIASALPMMPLVMAGGVGIVLSAIFIFLPVAIISLMLCVAVPVCVMERPGVWASLALTAGHRWKILGVVFLIGIAEWLVSIAVGLTLNGGGALEASVAVGFVLSALMSLWISVAVAVIYHDLRIIKEGGAPTASIAAPA
jgi:hypothetical protein